MGGRYLTTYKQISKIYNKRFKDNTNKIIYKRSSFNSSNLAIKGQAKMLYFKSIKATHGIFYKRFATDHNTL